ncbi:MAG: helix-hairpin-helix domain-containing protein [Firmicutes bacterium]|nr:helix-hairpin-helix domain-containing protein [Bacillota bacterium]
MKVYVKKYYRYIIGGFIVLMIITLLVLFDDEPSQTPFLPVIETVDEEKISYIYVDIKGEVKNPGVYKVITGSRLFQVVSLAGGVTSEADELAINFAIQLSDQQVIYIPNISDEFPLITDNTNDESSLININTASLELLDTLPGIGPATAQSIINYRLENGNYTTIEDLLNVPGIGEGTISEIRNFITV